MMWFSVRLPVVLLALSLMTGAPPVGAGEPGPTASGAELFAHYCASCHGRGGHGDGPAAPELVVEPADLTGISARNGGRFPAERIRDRIDGRVIVPAHGPREMPVWGYQFEADGEDVTERLVDFLRSIQR